MLNYKLFQKFKLVRIDKFNHLIISLTLSSYKRVVKYMQI